MATPPAVITPPNLSPTYANGYVHIIAWYIHINGYVLYMMSFRMCFLCILHRSYLEVVADSDFRVIINDEMSSSMTPLRRKKAAKHGKEKDATTPKDENIAVGWWLGVFQRAGCSGGGLFRGCSGGGVVLLSSIRSLW